MILAVTIMVFIAVLCTIEGVFATWKFDESKKIREKLKTLFGRAARCSAYRHRAEEDAELGAVAQQHTRPDQPDAAP